MAIIDGPEDFAEYMRKYIARSERNAEKAMEHNRRCRAKIAKHTVDAGASELEAIANGAP